MEEITLTGTSLTQVKIGASDTLSKIALPATLEEISLIAQPNLTELTFEGYSNLDKVEIDAAKVGSFSTLSFAQNIYAGKIPDVLTTAKFYNIEWTDVSADVLMFLASAGVSVLTGSIAMRTAASDRYLTLSEVLSLADKFGNIQDSSNDLYIDYPKRNITGIALLGEKYIFKPNEGEWDGTFPFAFTGWSIETYPSSGNNVKIGSDGRQMVTYALSSGYTNYAAFTDAVKGHLSVSALQNALTASPFTLTITMTLADNSTVSVTKKVGFYKRVPKLGDCAYLDGTFDSEFDKTKGLAGVVIDCQTVLDNGTDVGTRKVTVLAKEEMKITDRYGNTWETHVAGSYSGDSYMPNALRNAILNTLGVDVNLPIPSVSGSSVNLSTASNYLDDNTDDGYKVTTNGYLNDFATKAHTDGIVAAAKTVITASDWGTDDYPEIDTNEPTSQTELGTAMTDYKTLKQNAPWNDTNVTRWEILFFPSVYGCALYEPESEIAGEAIADVYKKGKWMLPAIGLLARIFNFYWNSKGRSSSGTISSTNANENPTTEARTPIFANMLKRMEDAGVTNTAEQPFKSPVNNGSFLSSTYSGSVNALCIAFGNGNISTINASNNQKRPARAVNILTFTL